MEMKNVLVAILIGILTSPVTPTFAATDGRVDDSHLLTYIFLTICGLIILFQLVPVVSLVRDLLKGAAARQSENDMEKLKAATSKYH
jgi:hypothetical protein